MGRNGSCADCGQPGHSECKSGDALFGRGKFDAARASAVEQIKRIADPELAARNRNTNVLADFVAYCQAHPEMRFWQALTAWCGSSVFLLRSGSPSELVQAVRRHEYDRGRDGSAFDLRDTFYWEGKGE